MAKAIKRSPMARVGAKNGRYKDGSRTDYRAKLGIKTGEKKMVHHKDGNRNNNSPSNLQVLKTSKSGANTSSKHEKITKRGQGRKKK